MWLIENFLYRFILCAAVFAVVTVTTKLLSVAADLPSVFGWVVGFVAAIVFVAALIHESYLDYKEECEENDDVDEAALAAIEAAAADAPIEEPLCEEDDVDEAVAYPAMPLVPQEVQAKPSPAVPEPAIQPASAEEQEMLRREQEVQVTALSSAAENSRQASISEDEAALAAIESAAADVPVEEPPPYEDEEDYYYPPADDYAEIFGNSGEN